MYDKETLNTENEVMNRMDVNEALCVVKDHVVERLMCDSKEYLNQHPVAKETLTNAAMLLLGGILVFEGGKRLLNQGQNTSAAVANC